MAIQNQTQGQLQEVLALLQRRVWQILLPAVVTGAVGVMAASLLPRKYQARTKVELVDLSGMPLQVAGFDPSFLKANVWAAEFHIKSSERIRRVIEALEWEDFQTLPPDGQRRYLTRVIGSLNVQPIQVRNTNATFLNLSYTDADPQRAAQFVNEVRDIYISEKVEAVRQKAVATRDKLQQQYNDAEANYDAAFNAARELRRQYNLSPTQQAPGGGRTRDEDPVFVRLSQAETKRDQTQLSLAQAQRMRDSLQAQYEEQPKEVADTTVNPGVNVSNEVSRIVSEIAAQKALQDGIKPAHSRWMKAQKEIERLEAQREQLLGSATATTTDVRMMPNPRLKTLLADIDARDVEIAGHQEALKDLDEQIKLLQVEVQQRSDVYSRLSYLDSTLAMAATSRDAANIAFVKQRNLVDQLMQPEFSPFEVTEYALPPTEPSSPNVPLVILASIAAGLALGLAIALLAEFGRNAFRGPSDIGRALPVPVLAAVNLIQTAGQRRTVAFRRGLIGVSTLILAGAILWITWAYENRPRMLGSDLTRFLDELRASLR